MARKTSKSKTPDDLDRTKALQQGLELLMDEARQIRAMVEKLNAHDDARELRRLLKKKGPEPWEPDGRSTPTKSSRRPN